MIILAILEISCVIVYAVSTSDLRWHRASPVLEKNCSLRPIEKVIFFHLDFLFDCLFYLNLYVNSKINKSLLKILIDKTSHNRINNICINFLNKTNEKNLKVKNDTFDRTNRIDAMKLKAGKSVLKKKRLHQCMAWAWHPI